MSNLLSVQNLVVHYLRSSDKYNPFKKSIIHAVCDVSFELKTGETLALIGESGCGKTTTLSSILGLRKITSGKIIFEDEDISRVNYKIMRRISRNIQIVFQDPYSSFDPMYTTYNTLIEPLKIHNIKYDNYTLKKYLDMVNLDYNTVINRYPHQLSGGQRQRLMIARSLLLNPKLLLLDEPLSALDVSVRATIIEVLRDIQSRLNIALLLISHDLSIVRYLANNIAVMYLGKIVEYGTLDQFIKNTLHPYSQNLISSIPIPDPIIESKRKRILPIYEPLDITNLPKGCRFYNRCTTFKNILNDEQRKHCIDVLPELKKYKDMHEVACHYPNPMNILDNLNK